MKVFLGIIDTYSGEQAEPDTLMSLAGFADDGSDYDGIGITEEGLPIVLNSLGQYGYLDANRFEIRLQIGVD